MSRGNREKVRESVKGKEHAQS